MEKRRKKFLFLCFAVLLFLVGLLELKNLELTHQEIVFFVTVMSIWSLLVLVFWFLFWKKR